MGTLFARTAVVAYLARVVVTTGFKACPAAVASGFVTTLLTGRVGLLTRHNAFRLFHLTSPLLNSDDIRCVMLE